MIYICMSIRKEWAAKILDGEKVIEVRKSAPFVHVGEPIKVYLYETKSSGGAGAIVGEFVCPKVHHFNALSQRRRWDAMCGLTPEQLAEYQGKARELCGWEVTEPRRYAKAVPLKTLGLYAAPQSWCKVKTYVCSGE